MHFLCIWSESRRWCRHGQRLPKRPEIDLVIGEPISGNMAVPILPYFRLVQGATSPSFLSTSACDPLPSSFLLFSSTFPIPLFLSFCSSFPLSLLLLQDPRGRTACIPYVSFTPVRSSSRETIYSNGKYEPSVHLSIPTLAISSIQGCKPPPYPLSTFDPLKQPEHTLFYGNVNCLSSTSSFSSVSYHHSVTRISSSNLYIF